MAPQSDSSSAGGQTGDHYVVVARRYRPQLFDQLVGQHQVAQALTNAIKANRTGHAYLFTGARGVGKTSTARIFAKALNCVEGPTPEPCNVCDICQSITRGDDVDVLEIDGASNRGVDEIRQLRSNVGVRPSRARFKIYIIDEVHMLTREAFNALLKTLEEPPEHVKFIFCTTDPEKIPITVLSRCQRFDFAPVESASIFERLKFIAQNEGIEAEDQALQFLARQAGGSMRDSQSLLEQLLSFCADRVTLDDVHNLLGTARSGRLSNLAQEIGRRDTQAALAEVDAALAEGVDAGRLAEQLIAYFRDMMTATVGCDADLLLHCSPEEHGELVELGKPLGLETILAIIQILDDSLVRMRQSAHARTLLELAIVRITQLEDLRELSALVEQVRKGSPLTVIHGEVPAGSGGSTSASRPHPPSAPAAQPSPPPSSSSSSSAAPSSPEARGSGSKAADSSGSSTPSVAPSSGPSAQKKTEDGAVTALKEAPRPQPGPPLSPHRAKEIWTQALATLEDMTADFASHFESVATSGPNTLVVFFKTAYNLKSCERPERRAKIEQALAEAAGQTVRVEFRLTEADQAEAKPHEPPKTRRQLMKEAEKHPFVSEAMELFDAELIRLNRNASQRPAPRPSASGPSQPGSSQ